MNSTEFFSRRSGMTLAGVAAKCHKPLALAIGVFDGVHLGHKKLLAEVAAMAQELDAVPVALTFDPHPRAVLQPARPPVLLVDLPERIRLLQNAGMAMTAVVDFTGSFAATLPEEFLELLLEQVPRLAAVGVGSNWRFGKNGAGNVELLKKYAAQRNFKLAAVDELVMDDEVVSASRIRRLIAGGKLDEAEKLLGYRYMLSGKVSNGYGIAGTHLDCPTANIEPAAGVLPPDGVYSGIVEVDKVRYGAAVNIGVAPTYGRAADSRRRIEAHLLDFSGNLYGRNVHLILGEYLRSEQCFASEEALKKQIFKDVEQIRNWVKNK
ncbi:MAG: bifunctional riboflavin kinase/FAD synthetase [Lentisphaeria bacterium]|nr:bifunctional riboflavin kinase/FAD synthetase [Lentisphaeria bacterium]